MCFGGSAKPQSVELPAAAPLPAPSPVPMPEDTNPQQTADQKRNRTQALKYGALSLYKTQGGAKGITGAGPDLYNQSVGGKQNLGS